MAAIRSRQLVEGAITQQERKAMMEMKFGAERIFPSSLIQVTEQSGLLLKRSKIQYDVSAWFEQTSIAPFSNSRSTRFSKEWAYKDWQKAQRAVVYGFWGPEKRFKLIAGGSADYFVEYSLAKGVDATQNGGLVALDPQTKDHSLGSLWMSPPGNWFVAQV